MRRVLCLDPGGKTGLAIFDFEATSEANLIHYEEVPDGLNGFIAWYKANRQAYSWDLIKVRTVASTPGWIGLR